MSEVHALTCPNCGASVEITAAPGELVKCAYCGVALQLPEAPHEETPPPVVINIPEAYTTPSYRGKQKTGAGFWIVMILPLIGLIIGLVAAFGVSRASFGAEKLIGLQSAPSIAMSLPWFAEALRQDHGQPRSESLHRIRLGMLLRRCPTVVQMWFTDHPLNYAQFAGQENQVLLPTLERRWAIHDLATGRVLYSPFGPATGSDTVSTSPGSPPPAVPPQAR